jgi:mannose-6-phosphate isomerase-like protein (cupin superfamily)
MSERVEASRSAPGPRGEDPQTPHEQDEIYVVTEGHGSFALGRDEAALERRRFGPGDVIFAPAGWVHRFEDFSDDFATWVVFWGAKGGEGETRPGADAGRHRPLAQRGPITEPEPGDRGG